MFSRAYRFGVGNHEVSVQVFNNGRGAWKRASVRFPEGTKLPTLHGTSPLSGSCAVRADGLVVSWDYCTDENWLEGTMLPADETVLDDARALIAWVCKINARFND